MSSMQHGQWAGMVLDDSPVTDLRKGKQQSEGGIEIIGKGVMLLECGLSSIAHQERAHRVEEWAQDHRKTDLVRQRQPLETLESGIGDCDEVEHNAVNFWLCRIVPREPSVPMQARTKILRAHKNTSSMYRALELTEQQPLHHTLCTSSGIVLAYLKHR